MKIKFLFFILSSLILLQLFQNCKASNVYQMSSLNGPQNADAMSISHPPDSELPRTGQKVLVANKIYVATLMRDIFKRGSEDPGLEGLINQWIYNRPSQFGGSCSSYDSYSQVDCGGDISNANNAMNVDHNTIRESYRLQFCRNTLGVDEFVVTALRKINLTVTQQPSSQSAVLMYSLFYRDEEANPLVMASLMDLDRSLTMANEALIERWRAQLLVLCESPGWQLL